MKSTSQAGFALGAAIGIIAILALLGGGAYVANNKGKMATSTNATTTEQGGFEQNANENAQQNANENATTSVGADVSADAKADAGANASTSTSTSNGGAGVNFNAGGGIKANY
jgi:hypothetical protein